MLRCAAVYLHNAQLLNLCGARLLNRLDIGRATVVELDLREVRFGSKAEMATSPCDVRFTHKSRHKTWPRLHLAYQPRQLRHVGRDPSLHRRYPSKLR